MNERRRSYREGGLEERKYVVTKTSGDLVDPSAWYFVLRCDNDGDPHGVYAAFEYALSVMNTNVRLGTELLRHLMNTGTLSLAGMTGELSKRRRTRIGCFTQTFLRFREEDFPVDEAIEKAARQSE